MSGHNLIHGSCLLLKQQIILWKKHTHNPKILALIMSIQFMALHGWFALVVEKQHQILLMVDLYLCFFFSLQNLVFDNIR